MTFEEILSRFSGPRKPNGQGGFLVECPGHQSKSKHSLSISPGNGSGPLFNDFGGCDTETVLAAVGLTWQDVLPPKENPRKSAPPAASRTPEKITRYEIKDVTGVHTFHHVRKDFADGDKDMFWEPKPSSRGVKSSDLELYGVDRLPDDATVPVVVCEGEKATDALLSNGTVAVGTVTGASGTPGDDALRPLLGRTVYLWNDNDPPGRKHMDKIGAALLRLGHTDLRLIDWKGAPEKGDAADLFQLEGARDEFDALMEEAREFTMTNEPAPATTPAVATDPVPAEVPDFGFTEKFRATDLWAARLFAFQYRGQVKHCPRRGGWFVYDGKRWLRSECGEIERLTKELPRAILELALMEQDSEERAKMFKFAAAEESASRIASMLTLAATEEGIAVPPEAFDAQPWLLNVANGTLDLTTGELLPHRPEDMLTNLSPAEWRGRDTK